MTDWSVRLRGNAGPYDIVIKHGTWAVTPEGDGGDCFIVEGGLVQETRDGLRLHTGPPDLETVVTLVGAKSTSTVGASGRVENGLVGKCILTDWKRVT